MSDEEKKPNEEGQARPNQPKRKPADDETISLTELMRQLSGEQEEPADDEEPPADQPASRPTPPPIIISRSDIKGDDAPTPTGPGKIPNQLPEREQTPPPLYREELKPMDTPPVHDLDATVVSPRLDPLDEPDETVRSEDMPTIPMQPLPRRDPSAQRPTPPSPPRRTPSQAAPQRPPQGPQTPERGSTTPLQQQPLREPPRRPQPAQVFVPSNPNAGDIPKPKSRRQVNTSGCIRRFFIISIVLFILGTVLTVAGASIGYVIIASDLPPVTELRNRASTFETARIYDRNGDLLYSLEDPNQGNRTYVTIDQISQNLIDATVATEDSRFWENPGFDPIGITRAIITAATEGDAYAGGGASTITQQLARALLLDEEERTSRDFSRKVREIILAAEMTRTYSKEEILELYLNEINYGNRAYGIEAAAQTYFGKSAA
ncbi:MAG: transglycosylase domain-containing protein, partial [Anaerolineales bacterium]|nr:transglycosylase domain-containing protein [Anaerolineales bacterium]